MAGRREGLGGLAGLLALGLSVVGACGDAPAVETAFLLEVELENGAPAPEFLLVSWFDTSRPLKTDQPVPASGALDIAAHPLATVRIDVSEPVSDLNRRVLVRAVRDNMVVARAIGKVEARPGRWLRVPLTLTTTLPEDSDGDGVPDEIDACTGNDLVGCPRR